MFQYDIFWFRLGNKWLYGGNYNPAFGLPLSLGCRLSFSERCSNSFQVSYSSDTFLGTKVVISLFFWTFSSLRWARTAVYGHKRDKSRWA